ncbi:glycoside hydrolase family 88 protein [Prosthecobacter fusiformis]|nr:glycoside hydrolase family 88 protein [Prosthecobacter fusiformis]
MNIQPLHFSRRQCLKTLSHVSLLGLGSRLGFSVENSPAAQHIALSLGESPDVAPEVPLVPGFLRFGWKSFAVGNVGSAPTTLHGLGEAAPAVPDNAECRLRLTNAVDVRNDYAIEVSTPDGEVIGTLPVRFAALYQVQEMVLTPAQARQVLKKGAVLKLVNGPAPLWFFAPSPEASPTPDVLQLPHVLIAPPGDPMTEFEHRLRGLVMLQGFGWQSGCASEGLLDLAEARKDDALLALVDRYLSMYFTADGVAFESPRSHPVKDRVGGIEEPLPWATLARRQPDHPALEIGRKFLSSDKISKHNVSLGQSLTTEGNYTAAYPTAVLSRVLKSEELATIALRQLEARRLTNIHDGDVYQSASMAGGKHLRNWCRGVCWYYLGLVRTIQALDDERATQSWLPEIKRVAAFLLHHQREDGLWGNFIHDPQSVTDTSGSAGLATALARAHASGWLKDDSHKAAQKTLAGLAKHLTPDGLLGGAAQSNKGGTALQEGSYRVIYQMGMGLQAQLIAALK